MTKRPTVFNVNVYWWLTWRDDYRHHEVRTAGKVDSYNLVLSGGADDKCDNILGINGVAGKHDCL